MRISFIVFILSVSAPVFAQMCPRLEGRFQCPSNPPFQLEIHNESQNGLMFYTFTDPSATQSIVPDGAPRELVMATGKGTYSARCDGANLVMDVRSPEGKVSHDRYYIECSALVRVRTSPGVLPQSLSCKPIAGTWRLYPPCQSRPPRSMR